MLLYNCTPTDLNVEQEIKCLKIGDHGDTSSHARDELWDRGFFQNWSARTHFFETGDVPEETKPYLKNMIAEYPGRPLIVNGEAYQAYGDKYGKDKIGRRPIDYSKYNSRITRARMNTRMAQLLFEAAPERDILFFNHPFFGWWEENEEHKLLDAYGMNWLGGVDESKPGVVQYQRFACPGLYFGTSDDYTDEAQSARLDEWRERAKRWIELSGEVFRLCVPWVSLGAYYWKEYEDRQREYLEAAKELFPNGLIIFAQNSDEPVSYVPVVQEVFGAYSS